MKDEVDVLGRKTICTWSNKGKGKDTILPDFSLPTRDFRFLWKTVCLPALTFILPPALDLFHSFHG